MNASRWLGHWVLPANLPFHFVWRISQHAKTPFEIDWGVLVCMHLCVSVYSWEIEICLYTIYLFAFFPYLAYVFSFGACWILVCVCVYAPDFWNRELCCAFVPNFFFFFFRSYFMRGGCWKHIDNETNAYFSLRMFVSNSMLVLLLFFLHFVHKHIKNQNINTERFGSFSIQFSLNKMHIFECFILIYLETWNSICKIVCLARSTIKLLSN